MTRKAATALLLLFEYLKAKSKGSGAGRSSKVELHINLLRSLSQVAATLNGGSYEQSDDDA